MNYINEKETNKIFSKNLKYYLNLNDISQVDLAKKIDVTPASVSNWCNGIKTPRMDKIDKLCKIFNINRSDLIEDKPKQNKQNNIELSNQEKALINKFRQLNEQQQYEVIGYIDGKLNHTDTVKESTPIYKIDKNTHFTAAEKENIYNINKPKKTVRLPLVSNTGDNKYVDIDLDILEELDTESEKEFNKEYEYKKKTRELLEKFNLDKPDDE